MGFSKSKMHHRDEVSGLHVHDDITPGTYGAMDLSKRNQARQDSMNAANKADWPKDMTSSNPEHSDPTLGNAFSRLPKPSDYSSKGGDRFGVSETPGKQVAKPGSRSNSKVSK